MLKMKCPNCSEFIISKLLAEIDRITCGHCGENVPVKDVMVFAKGFTFHRDDLAKRLFRYKTLINEVAQERAMLENNAKASPESKKSLDQFLHALKEVMDGARNSLRLEFSDQVPVRFVVNQVPYEGSLVNLSTTGACLESYLPIPSLKKRDSISLHFSIAGHRGEFSLNGLIIWAGKAEDRNKPGNSIGVEFRRLDENIHQALWEIISEASA